MGITISSALSVPQTPQWIKHALKPNAYLSNLENKPWQTNV